MPLSSAVLIPTSTLPQVRSISKIPQSLASSPFDNVNTITRHKRPTVLQPARGGRHELKREMLQMLTNWKEEQDSRFAKLTSDQSITITKLMADIIIEKNITFINKKYDDMFTQLNTLLKEKQAYKDSILAMETKIQDLQQMSRTSSIEIRNVSPVKENESPVELSDVVTKIGSSVNLYINTQNIRDIYRLPGKAGVTRPIVTKFTSVQTKFQFLQAVRNFNKKHPKERLSSLNIGKTGDPCPIYVAKYLPASSKKLFFAAREFAKLKDYQFCWTTNGNIFLRKTEGAKQILVRSEQTLRDLQVRQ